jgi:hypothetical protein
MKEDILKSAWQDVSPEPKSNEAIKSMMREGAHPVLKGIRRQMIIETVAFTVFLLVYHDFFDGNRKPVYANVLLVMGLLLVVIHNVVGYVLAKKPLTGDTIRQSLTTHLAKMKVFAVISVISRMLAAGCLLLFFTCVIRFTAGKFWIMSAVVIMFLIQITLLSGIWAKRIKQLRRAINDF